MPTLSLCMIVKDEEKNLPRCLQSVAGAVDEIVVVDTGSKDRTIEVARSFGAKVVEWAWRNDFAAARNVSLDHATGDWLLYLDADEELVAGDGAALRKLLEDEANEGFFLQEVNFAGERPGFDQVNFATFRLFRNRPEYRFKGALHEQVMPELLSRGRTVAHSTVRLRHYGYLDSHIEAQAKVTRNLKLAQAEVERRPKDAFALFNLGMEYVRSHEWEKALQVNQRAFLNLPDLTVQYASRLLRNLVVSLMGLKRYGEALKVLEDAVQAYPDFTDLFYQQALIYLETEDYARAATGFRLCVEKGESSPRHISDQGVGTYRALFGLGYALEMLGDYRAAREAYEQSLHTCRTLPGAVHRLAGLLLKELPPEDVRRRLEALTDLEDPLVLTALTVAFREAKEYERALAYAERGIALRSLATFLPTKGDLLLHLGRYREAAELMAAVAGQAGVEAAPSLASFAGLAWLFAGEPGEAERWWTKASGAASERGRVVVFRRLAALLAGTPLPKEPSHPSTAERLQHLEAVWTILGFLLERREFDAFEVAVGLVDLLHLAERDRHLQLGKLYYAFGFSESAVEELSQVSPEELDAEAADALGQLCEAQGMTEDALNFFRLALQREPESLTRHASLARKALHFGERELALDVARQGLRRYPEHRGLREVEEACG